jgi:hypothetical protein
VAKSAAVMATRLLNDLEQANELELQLAEELERHWAVLCTADASHWDERHI